MMGRRGMDATSLARANADAVVQMALLFGAFAASLYAIYAGLGLALFRAVHEASPSAVQRFDLAGLAMIWSHAVVVLLSLPLLAGLSSMWWLRSVVAPGGSTVRLVVRAADRLLRFARALSQPVLPLLSRRSSMSHADLTAVVRQLCDALMIAPTGPPSTRTPVVLSSSFIGRPAT